MIAITPCKFTRHKGRQAEVGFAVCAAPGASDVSLIIDRTGEPVMTIYHYTLMPEWAQVVHPMSLTLVDYIDECAHVKD